MKIHVGSKNPTKTDAVKEVFERVFRNKSIEVSGIDVDSKVPEQPLDDETIQGAIERAKGAIGDADFGVGIEAGLISSVMLNTKFDVQYCAVIDQNGKVSLGHGPGFVYPQKVLDDVKSGKTVSEAMQAVIGIEDIGRTIGAIGYLSEETLNRKELSRSAILMALLPWIKKELY